METMGSIQMTYLLSDSCHESPKRKGYPANIYLLKVTNRNTSKRCEICLKLTIKAPERRQ